MGKGGWPQFSKICYYILEKRKYAQIYFNLGGFETYKNHVNVPVNYSEIRIFLTESQHLSVL